MTLTALTGHCTRALRATRTTRWTSNNGCSIPLTLTYLVTKRSSAFLLFFSLQAAMTYRTGLIASHDLVREIARSLTCYLCAMNNCPKTNIEHISDRSRSGRNSHPSPVGQAAVAPPQTSPQMHRDRSKLTNDGHATRQEQTSTNPKATAEVNTERMITKRRGRSIGNADHTKDTKTTTLPDSCKAFSRRIYRRPA